jgi:hypothetical protein
LGKNSAQIDARESTMSKLDRTGICNAPKVRITRQRRPLGLKPDLPRTAYAALKAPLFHAYTALKAPLFHGISYA